VAGAVSAEQRAIALTDEAGATCVWKAGYRRANGRWADRYVVVGLDAWRSSGLGSIATLRKRVTLLLTAGDSTQLHQSSDYRISAGGNALETSNGVKQISVSSRQWVAQIAFTGIASDGSRYNTRDWLVSFLTRATPTVELGAFAADLAQAASINVARAIANDTRLTLVIAAAQDELCRLFVVSNWESFGSAPARTPQRQFVVLEKGLAVPQLLVHGYAAAVSRASRRQVIRLIRDRAHPKEIRDLLAQINQSVAKSTRRHHIISPECWVHSLLSDGQSAGVNDGGTPGVQPIVHLGVADLTDMLKAADHPGIPATPVIIQSAGYRGAGIPMPPPTGEQRTIPFSSSAVASSVGPPDGSAHATLSISRADGLFGISKNGSTVQSLGSVSLSLCDASRQAQPYRRRHLEMPNPPLIDGVKPRTWKYPHEVEWDGATLSVTFLPTSMAFRSANHDTPLTHLGAHEELVMVAPERALKLSVTEAAPTAELPMFARFTLRDFPELGLVRRPI